jgi:hypothetical protein
MINLSFPRFYMLRVDECIINCDHLNQRKISLSASKRKRGILREFSHLMGNDLGDFRQICFNALFWFQRYH